MMAAEQGGEIVTFVFNGEEDTDDDIPDDVTHLIVHENISVIPMWLFYEHPNLVEVYCHAGVIKIGGWAFSDCPRLKRLILLGVIEVERAAFCNCHALSHVECPQLEKVGQFSFDGCKSLRDINLPSARTVEECAFTLCEAMKEVTFGSGAFRSCPSLDGITIPLKNNLFPYDNAFQGCKNLRQVTLVAEDMLVGTVNALFLEVWRNKMRRVIDSINHNLPSAYAGDNESGDAGEKTIVIRSWISLVLSKIIDYKAQHRGILIEAETSLRQLGLPLEIVKCNVLPFLELPAHTFHGENINVVIKPKVIGKIDKEGDNDGGALRRFLAPKAIRYAP